MNQDDLFAWEDIYPDLDVKSITGTIVSLLEAAVVVHGDEEENLPDLVPRGEPAQQIKEVSAEAEAEEEETETTTTLTSEVAVIKTPNPDVETVFLLAVLLGTILLLYLFPADPPPTEQLEA